MNYLTLASPVLQRYLQALRSYPYAPVRCPIGISRWSGHLECLSAFPGSSLPRVLLLSWTDRFSTPHPFPSDCTAALLLGHGDQLGRMRGVIRLSSGTIEPFDVLRVVGPEMHTIALRQQAQLSLLPGILQGSDLDAATRWSRTIGTLNMDVWRRLINFRYGIIGVGRMGGIVALALASIGAGKLTLIDPDHVELHNLGETFVLTPADLGRPKVEAIARFLGTRMLPGLDVLTFPESITRLRAFQAAQACDVLVSCVDHDSARLAATVIAAMFCKPLLDLATGIHGHGMSRHMGADVRLVLPGRCLLCLGGLRNEAEARQVLASAEAEEAFYAHRNWQQERAGSLVSLNMGAAGMALGLWQDLLAERVADSTWLHLEIDTASQGTISYPPLPSTAEFPPCPLCAMTGWGEEGVPHLANLLRQDRFWRTRVGDSTP